MWYRRSSLVITLNRWKHIYSLQLYQIMAIKYSWEWFTTTKGAVKGGKESRFAMLHDQINI